MSVPATRTSPLAGLGVTSPVLAAPMAGGPTTAALATAAARSGGMGFLAGGYKTAEQLHAQLAEVRAATPVFGVNLFAPSPLAIEPAEYHRYAAALRPLAERYGVELPPEPVEDADYWEQKLDLLRRDPVPVVSSPLGCEHERSHSRRGLTLPRTSLTLVLAPEVGEDGGDGRAGLTRAENYRNQCGRTAVV
jgi:NAD(P)H-dependent flavin oxidoreductase YrpB (nitropropane dioxygenase family)